jgi:hypothetical protein
LVETDPVVPTEKGINSQRASPFYPRAIHQIDVKTKKEELAQEAFSGLNQAAWLVNRTPEQ